MVKILYFPRIQEALPDVLRRQVSLIFMGQILLKRALTLSSPASWPPFRHTTNVIAAPHLPGAHPCLQGNAGMMSGETHLLDTAGSWYDSCYMYIALTFLYLLRSFVQ